MNTDLIWFALNEVEGVRERNKVNVCAKGERETVNVYWRVIWLLQNNDVKH